MNASTRRRIAVLSVLVVLLSLSAARTAPQPVAASAESGWSGTITQTITFGFQSLEGRRQEQERTVRGPEGPYVVRDWDDLQEHWVEEATHTVTVRVQDGRATATAGGDGKWSESTRIATSESGCQRTTSISDMLLILPHHDGAAEADVSVSGTQFTATFSGPQSVGYEHYFDWYQTGCDAGPSANSHTGAVWDGRWEGRITGETQNPCIISTGPVTSGPERGSRSDPRFAWFYGSKERAGVVDTVVDPASEPLYFSLTTTVDLVKLDCFELVMDSRLTVSYPPGHVYRSHVRTTLPLHIDEGMKATGEAPLDVVSFTLQSSISGACRQWIERFWSTDPMRVYRAQLDLRAFVRREADLVIDLLLGQTESLEYFQCGDYRDPGRRAFAGDWTTYMYVYRVLHFPDEALGGMQFEGRGFPIVVRGWTYVGGPVLARKVYDRSVQLDAGQTVTEQTTFELHQKPAR